MDAVKYFKTKEKMTDCSAIKCNVCPLSYSNNGLNVDCVTLERKYPEKAVEIVETWLKEHPIKTRQSEFLKMFPNIEIDENGIIAICPNCIDKDYSCFGGDTFVKCRDCRNKFWSEEIE